MLTILPGSGLFPITYVITYIKTYIIGGLSYNICNYIYYNYSIFVEKSKQIKMDWYSLSDPAVMNEIGERLKEYRLRKNYSQKELASVAGISVLSVQNLEKGNPVSMTTFISIIRMLRILGNMEALIPELPLSPVELLKLKGKTRERAKKKRLKF